MEQFRSAIAIRKGARLKIIDNTQFCKDRLVIVQFALATVVLLCSLFSVGASTPSYWFSGFQVKPDAKQAQAYFFLEGTGIVFTYTNNRVVINTTGGGGGGTNGLNGTNGVPGVNGTNGVAGSNGTNGLAGTSGTNGATGLQGPPGTNVVSMTNNQFQTVDMNIKEGDFQTNAAFAFLGIINKSTTNYQSVVITVTNSSGAAVAITAPPGTHTNGTLPYNVTNVSHVLVYYSPSLNYTSMYVFPEY